jgi:uncharacterized protein
LSDALVHDLMHDRISWGEVVTAEPDMENLLASIRQAIDNDLGEVRRPVASSVAQPVRGSMNEMRVRVGEQDPRVRAAEIAREINELRSKIGSQRATDPPKPKTPFAQIMAGDLQKAKPAQTTAVIAASAPRQEEAEAYSETPDEAYNPYATEEEWRHQEQAYLPAPDHGSYDAFSEPPLMSDNSARAANSSFNELADTLMARAMGQRSIEDVTHELLRSMLRNWLDTHLPNMVERLVREEIERVARRGR